MNNYNAIKETLFSIIAGMKEHISDFVISPGKDFVRNRKLDFETIIKLLLTFEAGNLDGELLKYFDYAPELPSASAFCQQRSKLRPDAFYYLFQKFNQHFSEVTTYCGYQLLACDGSKCMFSPDPKDKDHYIPCNLYSAVNEMHMNAIYDLMGNRYLDVMIQSQKSKNEQQALCEMIDQFETSHNVLFIADRNYESYNLMRHVMEKNMKFLIRAKDSTRGGILCGLSLPEEKEYDYQIPLTLTRTSSRKNKKEDRIYKTISTGHTFDYMKELEDKDYDMDVRVIRITLGDDKYEALLTNLSPDEFTSDEIKELYHMRWGIETSFRKLKYALALTHFHAKKPAFIQQEILARFVLYNFCALIGEGVVIEKGRKKHMYQLNFTRLAQICRNFLKYKKEDRDLERLILKYLLPIRPGRRYKRNKSHKRNQSFIYRI